MQTTLIAAGLAAVVAGGTGYWLGSGIESGNCAKQLNAGMLAYANERNDALEAARRDASAAAQRSVLRARMEADAAARRTQDRLTYELEIARLARPECAMPAAVFERVRDRAVRANAGRTGATAAGGMPDGVPSDAGTDRAD